MAFFGDQYWSIKALTAVHIDVTSCGRIHAGANQERKVTQLFVAVIPLLNIPSAEQRLTSGPQSVDNGISCTCMNTLITFYCLAAFSVCFPEAKVIVDPFIEGFICW